MPAPARTCSAPGCDREAIAKGLCMRHYKRKRAGRPLETPQVGSPDGYGRYGILEDDGQRVMCHECGAWVVSVGSHVGPAHGMSAREYKLAHGLPLTRGLVSSAERERMSARGKREAAGTPAWKRLEAARDPKAASRARDADTWAALSAARRRGPDPTDNLPAWEPRVVSCVVCGATWCVLPGGSPRATCSTECSRAAQSAGALRQGRETRERLRERDERIRRALWAGSTYREVAAVEGLTERRIWQIAHEY